jgi:hypothetical protein
MNSVLLADLVDRLYALQCFKTHLRLELRTVNLAFLALTYLADPLRQRAA